jgi:hypothetical protein
MNRASTAPPGRARSAAPGYALRAPPFGTTYTVAQLPARSVEGFAKRKRSHAALQQLGVIEQAGVGLAVIDQQFIHFVAEYKHIVPGDGIGQRLPVGVLPYRTGGVVGRIDDDQPRARANVGSKRPPVHLEVGSQQGQCHHGAAAQLYGGAVAIVGGFEEDDLVARAHERQDGCENSLRGPCRDGNLGIGVDGAASGCGVFVGDGLAQGGHAGHGGVLVVAVRDVVPHQGLQPFGRIKIGESLRQVDGAVLAGQRRHDGEDAGARIREFG